MTQKDKELLFRDLCARLPYGVQVQINIPYVNVDFDKDYDYITNLQNNCILTLSNISEIQKMTDDIKPYLRSLSSMTDEEREKTKSFVNEKEIDYWGLIDFYNSIHLDYKGLIPKGLALEAPEGMYKID